MQIKTMKEIITSGGEHFPIYIGFAKASELLQHAEVPNFSDTTPNYEIAQSILQTPVEKWQRPLIREKKEAITRLFSDQGSYMPNPVLLSENCHNPNTGISTVQHMNLGHASGMETLNIPPPQTKDGKKIFPLWIIDGQHRITGLGAPDCKQNQDKIPVVLLLNLGSNSYDGASLAKIFAHVTTEATALQPLHNEWLTYAFKLGPKYSQREEERQAMLTTSRLCRMTQTKQGARNPFYNTIKFNDKLDDTNTFLGKPYDCNILQTIICKHYYGQTAQKGYLTPEDLADRIVDAFNSLSTVVVNRDQSVFFGKNNHAQSIMCDAFLTGVFSHLLNKNKAATRQDWDSLLATLNFLGTDWNFHQHVDQNKKWVPKSKQLAIAVFKQAFEDGTLPNKSLNLWDILSGDNLSIELQFKSLRNETIVRSSELSHTVTLGSVKTLPIGRRKYMRVINPTINAKHIKIFGATDVKRDSPFSDRGFKFLPPNFDSTDPVQRKIEFEIEFTLYGGQTHSTKIVIQDWQ